MAKESKSPPPAETISAPSLDISLLPPRVAALREKILEACDSGDVEKLRIAFEWAETPPSIARVGPRPRGFGAIVDYLKAQSFDGVGGEWLAIARAVFTAPYVVQKRGPFTSYVWPAFAKVPVETLKGLDDAARSQMWACVRFADIDKQARDGRPLMQHAGVGQDGTWHYFWAVEPL